MNSQAARVPAHRNYPLLPANRSLLLLVLAAFVAIVTVWLKIPEKAAA